MASDRPEACEYMSGVGETLTPFSPPSLLIFHCAPPALPAPKSDFSLKKSSGTWRLSNKHKERHVGGKSGSTTGCPGVFQSPWVPDLQRPGRFSAGVAPELSLSTDQPGEQRFIHGSPSKEAEARSRGRCRPPACQGVGLCWGESE